MIKLIVLDVDGTMTDGRIIYDTHGAESKEFSVKDGLAISSWKKLGRKVAIITGRVSLVVERRAKELGVDFLVQNCKNKGEKVEEISKELGISLKEVCAIGDDLNDMKMLIASGKSFCPKDANVLIHPYVDEVLESNGGNGAVAEMIFKIVKEEKAVKEYIELWQ